MQYQPFQKAVPVWLSGLSSQMNLLCGFRAVVPCGAENAKLVIAACSCYRVFINNKFTCFGPARGPHGFHRVDEINLLSLLTDEENIVAVEVVGYNINSFYIPNQPPFIHAEIQVDGVPVAWTTPACETFPGRRILEHIQRTPRYSFQRTFSECWVMQEDSDAWRRSVKVPFTSETLIQTEEKTLIRRNLPYPTYVRFPAQSVVGRGATRRGGKLAEYRTNQADTPISDNLLGFPHSELEIDLGHEAQELVFTPECEAVTEDVRFPKVLGSSYATYGFGINKTGFIMLDVTCQTDTILYLLFDEILTEGDVDFLRLGCLNAVRFSLSCGIHRLQTFEPYTMQYLKVAVPDGVCTLNGLWITEYSSGSAITTVYNESDMQLQAIYHAAVETFMQNSADLYMDCPSRERAGWLCDSFFTARVEYMLTGKVTGESNFLENYGLPERFEHLPDGMLPMCYPADHYDGVFIPNWALWLILELEEHKKREPSSPLPELLRRKVYRLLDYFKMFENEYGLLEHLDSWVFIEWSRANDLTQDVNYPSNMLYAAALIAAGSLYSDCLLAKKGRSLQDIIRVRSFDGTFFIDNAVRKNGFLENTGERTEVCQYYAFFLGTASPEKYPLLWKTLIEDFGPERKNNNLYPDIAFANAFIGNYLRLDLLRQNGCFNQMLREIKGYFYYMVEKTGTLWENDSDIASCNHGFSSYVAYLLMEAARFRLSDDIRKR